MGRSLTGPQSFSINELMQGGVGAARRRRNLKIYCDTSVLPENIGDADSKSRKELEAVKELQKLGMFRHEVMNTKDASKRDLACTRFG